MNKFSSNDYIYGLNWYDFSTLSSSNKDASIFSLGYPWNVEPDSNLNK